MSDEVQYWLASRPAGMRQGDLREHLRAGSWESPNPAGHRAKLAAMRPGDRIALKSTRTAKSGLPFFTADLPVSVMTIHAVGSVESVDADGGAVQVRWDPNPTPRDWYFFTYVAALTQIGPEHRSAARLIEFAFHGAEQDLDYYLREDPYWTSRYPKPPGFTWIPWFEEFATRLLDFRDDRGPLVEVIVGMARDTPLLRAFLGDQPLPGERQPMRDVDPFTVFTGFNRWVTDENRRQIVEEFAHRLGIRSPIPTDFDGVPFANNQNAWFVAYEMDREPSDIDALWRVFSSALRLTDSDNPQQRTEFIDAFDAALTVKKVSWNLTVGLFWSRPWAFPALDSPSRAFIKERFGISPTLGGSDYLELRDRLLERMGKSSTSITSFPLLSYAAWSIGSPSRPAHSVAGFAQWAARIAESVDLDAEENDYKRGVATQLAQVRGKIEDGDPTWGDSLREALKGTNLLDYRLVDDVLTAVSREPEQAAACFARLWAKPHADALDGFAEDLAGLLGSVQPGSATSLGSVLLLADDPEANPPYRARTVDSWHALVGKPQDYTSSATARYSAMLDFLDSLAETMAEHLGARPSPLETQGLAWATTNGVIPDGWSKEDRQALEQWRKLDDDQIQRAWLVRPREVDLDDWLTEGFVSLAANNLSDVRPGTDVKKVRAAVDKGYVHVDYSQRKALTAEYYAFLSQMKPGDVVVAQEQDQIHVGLIDGRPEYTGVKGSRLRREVSWRAAAEVADVSDIKGLLDLQGTVVDITAGLEPLLNLLERGEDDEPPRGPVDSVPTLPAVTEELADGLHMDRTHLQEILDLLQHRQQIVLYGPPGTGKTYLAMELARHIAGPEDRSRVQLVQFHPSYAYEDFFEGFRPKETDSGQATFELTDGPLRRIASAATAEPGAPHVLVIDEMNRANLAKVFGELYFLLEYRKESIGLQYNPGEAFQLPRNLFFIGTMNTADRSIALLDAAMRRRFSFVELHPDEPPVRDVLSRWLTVHQHSAERAALLRALNAAIEEQDRDLRIGPSYLMRDEAKTEEGLQRVWRYDILPLLEEHYYGRLSREQVHDRFGLDGLRAMLAAADDEQS